MISAQYLTCGVNRLRGGRYIRTSGLLSKKTISYAFLPEVGWLEGKDDGTRDGVLLGMLEGSEDGTNEGEYDGYEVGCEVGRRVGNDDGTEVGMAVG